MEVLMTNEKDIQKNILNAATKDFIAKGKSGARMQEIADEAGVNKMLLHYYFKTKELLFEEVLKNTLTDLYYSVVEISYNTNSFKDTLEVFIDKHFDTSKPVLLAGNSIHQDRRFIANEWSRVETKLHYRMLDVSAWKVVFEGKYKKRFSKPENHRALDDIRGSIQELEYYIKKIKV